MTTSIHHSCFLAIEASTPEASVCLWKDGKVIESATWRAERSHNACIFQALDQLTLLGDHYIPEVILVGSGPGSYSGVRVALAVADGLALIYGANVAAIPSWEALDTEGDSDYNVLSDARRQTWALGQIRGGILISPLLIESPEKMSELLHSEQSAGLKLYSTESEEKIAAQDWATLCKTNSIPRAEGLIHAWLKRDTTQQAHILSTPPSPYYVREPHITPSKKK